MTLLALKEAETAVNRGENLQAIFERLQPVITADHRFDTTAYLVSLRYDAERNNRYEFWYCVRWMIGFSKTRRIRRIG
jgi:hypothetical protein